MSSITSGSEIHGTGNFQQTIGDCTEMSQPSVSVCLGRVAAAIVRMTP